MLRIIIWADPSQKDKIIDKTTRNKKQQTIRQQEIENKQVEVDPKYFFLSYSLTCTKLSGTVSKGNPFLQGDELELQALHGLVVVQWSFHGGKHQEDDGLKKDQGYQIETADWKNPSRLRGLDDDVEDQETRSPTEAAEVSDEEQQEGEERGGYEEVTCHPLLSLSLFRLIANEPLQTPLANKFCTM